MADYTVQHVHVAFAGAGSGTGELTWGQRAAWRVFAADGEAKTLGGVVPAPSTATVERVADGLRFVVGRHQALRTRLRFQPDGDVRQEVATSGEVPLEVVDAADGADPAAVADQVRRRLQTEPFDYERDWPVRMAVVRHGGTLTHTVAVYLQTALDALGLTALTLDLQAYRSGAPVQPVTAIQPLELAAKQLERAALRQSEASLRQMESVLRAAPMHRWPEPVDPGPPVWDTLCFRSPALAQAVAAVARRRGMDTSPILLGAYALGLAEVTGVNPVAVMLAVSNRFRPRMATSVSPLAQVAGCLLDVAGATLDEVVGRAWQAAMSAYKHAYYDPVERFEVARRLGATRGGPRDLSCYFNDRRTQGLRAVTAAGAGAAGDPADLVAEQRRTELRWHLQPGFPQEIAYLNVDQVPGAIELALTVNTRVLARPLVERLLRRLEDAAVGMALHPDTPTGVPAGAAQRPRAGAR